MSSRCDLLAVCVISAVLLAGCQQQMPAPREMPTPTAAPQQQPTDATGATGRPPAATVSANATQPAIDRNLQFQQIADGIARRDFDAAQVVLSDLEAAQDKLSPGENVQWISLKERFEEEQQLYENEVRERLLTEAQAAIRDGQLDAATAKLQTLLAAAPTTEQSEQAEAMQRRIERGQTLRLRLDQGLALLASNERAKIDAAQEILWDEQDAALPLLLKSLESDNSVVVMNSLTLLRKFNQPQKTLPALVAILGRPQQSGAWPAVFKELQKSQQSGIGAPLLQLALTAPSSERAIPLFNAVAGIVDPPPETLILLLPKLYEDSATLPAILSAAYRAISVHHQFDLLTRRGLELELTPQQEQQLQDLPQRLQAIVKAGVDKPAAEAEAAWAAQRLAIAMRVMAPQAFSSVKVLRASAESQEGLATAVLDKVWNSIELKTMWRHPAKRYTTIVLDLGVERTVTGIRVWNGNEPNGTHRGWKDVEIFVSNDPSPTVPVADGIVPLAPGAANTPDYGAILQVPFARGRYVKLQLLSVWRDDGVAGLSELEVLGY